MIFIEYFNIHCVQYAIPYLHNYCYTRIFRNVHRNKFTSPLLYILHLEYFDNLPVASPNSTVPNNSQPMKLTSDEAVVKVFYACSTYKISICNKYF